jgi:hypothetical protein
MAGHEASTTATAGKGWLLQGEHGGRIERRRGHLLSSSFSFLLYFFFFLFSSGINFGIESWIGDGGGFVICRDEMMAAVMGVWIDG